MAAPNDQYIPKNCTADFITTISVITVPVTITTFSLETVIETVPVAITTSSVETITTISNIPHSCYTYLEPTPQSNNGKLLSPLFPSALLKFPLPEIDKSSQPTAAISIPPRAKNITTHVSKSRPSRPHATTPAAPPPRPLRHQGHVLVAKLAVRRRLPLLLLLLVHQRPRRSLIIRLWSLVRTARRKEVTRKGKNRGVICRGDMAGNSE
jgi:hypothetical protein